MQASAADFRALIEQGRLFFRGAAWARLEPELRTIVARLDRDEGGPQIFAPDGSGNWLLGPMSAPLSITPRRPASWAFFRAAIQRGNGRAAPLSVAEYGDVDDNAVRMARGRIAAVLEAKGLLDLADAIRGIVVAGGVARFDPGASAVRIVSEP